MQTPRYKEKPLPASYLAPVTPARPIVNAPSDHTSPTRQLQQELHQQLSLDTPDVTIAHWSLRRAIAFITLICCLFWLAIILAISALISL